MPGQSGGTGSSPPHGHESWSHIPARAVNWIRVRYRTKLAALALMAIALTGILLWLLFQRGERTNLVIIKPGKLSANWLATPPYLNSFTRDSLDSNAKYLEPFEPFDLLDPDSDGWKKLHRDDAIEFGGPDGQVLLFYINAVGVAYATDENDEKQTSLIACTLPADVSPFDSDHEIRRYSLEALLDQIVACDREKPGTKIVLIDSHPLSTPSNPGLLVDRLPQAVHDLYERKYKNDDDQAHRLVIICSHSPGQRNWPAPELDSSVFGFFTRGALLGAADGATGKGQDNKISFDEFCKYLTFHVTGHVGKYRMATQTPMILAPASMVLDQNANSQSVDLALAYYKPSTTLAESMNESGPNASERISALSEKYQLRQKWRVYADLESSLRLDREPLLAGRAAALLSRMEQLICELGIETDELVALDTEWTNLIKSIDKPKSFAPVSLAEADWLDQQEPKPGTPGNSNAAHLPNREQRASHQQTLSGWVQLQKIVPEKPAGDPAVVAGNVDSTGAAPGSVETNGESTPPEPGKVEVVAQVPNVDAEVLKKQLLEIERQPWLIAAMLWDGACRNNDFSPGRDNLDYWLKKLDEVSAPLPGSSAPRPGSLPINEFIELKFLHLLLQNVDWNSASPESNSRKAIEHAVRRAVQCRQACESFAINVDPRVLIWVSAEFRQLEDTRRIAEDYLFANQFDIAVELFDRVIEQLAETTPDKLGSRAQSLETAFSVRNEVARKSPHFAMLIARQILRNETTGKDVPSGVDFVLFRERWLALAKRNHQLAHELSGPSTVIEEAVTSASILRNTENILNMARDVKSSLDFLEGQLGEQCNYLADLKTDDTQAMVYIPDLLLSPLVTTRREDLRARYLKSIKTIVPDVGSGRSVQTVNAPYTNVPQQQFQEFLRSAERVNQQDFFTPMQQSISARPYRKDWETTRISSQSFEEIERLLEKEMDSAQSLPNQRRDLQNSDYWLRCVAAGLADYQNVFADSGNQPGDHFDVWSRTGSELNRVQESLHTNLKIERILADFWGNNQLADTRDPYFYRVATGINDRLGDEADEHRKLLDVTLQPLIASRLNSAREFQIACDDYNYLRNEADDEQHSFSVRANTELDQRTQIDGAERGPIAVAQLQLYGRWLSDTPLLINANNESATTAKRRIAYDLEMLRTGDAPKQLFCFPADSLPGLGDAQAVVCFRGHLADARFLVRAMDPAIPDSMPTISLAHEPSIWRAPTVLVNSDERAETDVVFVLDCSHSMSGSFRTGNIEGSDDSSGSAGAQAGSVVQTTRFQFLKRAIVDRLSQMRTSKLNRVGIVAIGSRVNFRQKGGIPQNELLFSDPALAKQWEAENVRPNNDAYVIANLTETAFWSDREWNVIEVAIDKLQPHGLTPLYSGMLKAADMLKPENDNRSKVMVVISDGVEETNEFQGAICEFDVSSSISNFDQLEKILPANEIKVFFVGFDVANDRSDTALRQKKRLNSGGVDLFNTRLDQIRSLAKGGVYFPEQIQSFKEDLDEIARARRFEVSRSGKLIADEKLNQDWQPGSIEEFQPGFYDISVQDSPASTSLWLEDGEFITLGFTGSDLELAKGRNSGANAIHSETKTLGRDKYSIFLFQPNLERPDMIPFEFLFERVPNNEFSFRPNRLCLEILPDPPSAEAPAYLLQDYRFVNKSEENAPAVQFASPGLTPGSYNLRLWTQPFREKRDMPSGQLYLADEHLNGRDGALKQPQQFGNNEVAIEAWGDSVERSITIRLTSNNPQLLRTLLVDLFVEDSPGKARNGIDFEINRVFAEPVLLADAAESTEPTPVFVEHTFFLDKRYHALPISFTVRPMDSIFGTSDFTDFPFRKD